MPGPRYRTEYIGHQNTSLARFSQILNFVSLALSSLSRVASRNVSLSPRIKIRKVKTQYLLLLLVLLLSRLHHLGISPSSSRSSPASRFKFRPEGRREGDEEEKEFFSSLCFTLLRLDSNSICPGSLARFVPLSSRLDMVEYLQKPNLNSSLVVRPIPLLYPPGAADTFRRKCHSASTL